MFESFYTSFWQHPLLLWLFPVAFLIIVRPRGGYFERALLIFLALTILDPLFTGPLTAFFAFPEGLANGVMIFFVLLGDFRFFFFVERFSRQNDLAQRSIVVAGALTFVVPLLQAGLIRVFPSAFTNHRHTFLAYELLFLVLAAYYRFVILPGRSLSTEVRSWLASIALYGMAYYGLWAAADIVILAGLDIGFLLRVIPNVLYYGLFLPFVYWKAPASLKRRGNQAGAEE